MPPRSPSPPERAGTPEEKLGHDGQPARLGVIREILRTRTYIPGSMFLVKVVDSHIIVPGRATIGTKRKRSEKRPAGRAVWLLLGNRSGLCVQAPLCAATHTLVDDGRIRVGCWVRLGRFRLRMVLRRDAGGELGEGTVVLVPQGVDVVRDGDEEPRRGSVDCPRDGKQDDDAVAVARDDNGDRLEDVPKQTPPSHEAHPEIQTTLENLQPAALTTPIIPSTQQPPTPTVDGDPSWHPYAKPGPIPNTSAIPWTSTDVARPLKLTSLRGIPLLPYKQNWAINILAVIAKLSPPEPSQLPPFAGLQRTARLADPSTSKSVLLTVFVDPEEFASRVGSVVLLLRVKNHRFLGGSLNNYVSDRPNGSRWWIENPEVEWRDTGGLRAWWREKKMG